MLSVQNLTINFTGNELFSDISFMIREKDRIGLVGKNGAGKTTLIKIICGLEQATKGNVVMSDDVSIGYLPQEKNVHSTKSVIAETLTALDEHKKIEARLAEIEAELANRSDYESESYRHKIETMSMLNERLNIIGALGGRRSRKNTHRSRFRTRRYDAPA